jgi:hypothetical protein
MLAIEASSRGKETEPPHEEPRVDSGPIHGSADAELSPLEHGTPRRKRQGNFDRKLTTADDRASPGGASCQP